MKKALIPKLETLNKYQTRSFKYQNLELRTSNLELEATGRSA